MANTTWNPADKTSGITLGGTNNLTATISGSAIQNVRSIDSNSTGKFYFEYTIGAALNTCWMGIANGAYNMASTGTTTGNPGAAVISGSGTMSITVNGTGSITLGGLPGNGTVCLAIDFGGQLLWARIGAAGNWNANATYSPGGTGGVSIPGVAGSGVAAYGLVGGLNANTMSVTANFGDSAFIGAVPSGFTPGFAPGGGGAGAARAMALVLA